MMDEILDDLAAEHDDLDRLVAPLSAHEWRLPTPSPDWTIADQISHLWFFDQRALMALTDPEAFAADMQWLIANGGTDASIEPGRALEPAALLDHWRADRGALIAAATAVDPSARIPWYGPPMAARSFITARLMETWAHGQDVADASHAARTPTARLRHVAHLGVRARPFSYAVRGLTMPDEAIAVRLTGPDGEQWAWDVEGAANDGAPATVTGPALDFCLVVTQRRHLADTRLRVDGRTAAEWMSIAQTFAGGAGTGRQPGQFEPLTDP